jgi:antitoxin YefM
MRTINITTARADFFNLVDSTKYEPIRITSKRNNAILISEMDWKSIQETLFLMSIPGMRESIIEGMQTPLEECSEDPGW